MLLQGAAVLVVPWLVMRYRSAKPLKLIGTIGAAYLLGIVVALVFWGLGKLSSELTLNSDVSEIGSYLAIGIAIPLLLFQSNLKETRKLSKRVLLSFGIVIVSVTVVTAAVYFLFGRNVEDGGILSAMAIGLYTGGTPNLNAIGNIFHLDSTSIGMANLADMMIGGVFYLFLLLACKPLFKRLFKNTKAQAVYYNGGIEAKNSDGENAQNGGIEATAYGAGDTVQSEVNSAQNGCIGETANVGENTQNGGIDTKNTAQKNGFLSKIRYKLTENKKVIRNILIAFLIAVIGAVIGVVIWVIGGSQDGRLFDSLVPSIMITGTILGIAASFNKKIRSVEKSGEAGHYLLLVFSFALAMAVNPENIQDKFLGILALYSVITVGTMIVHVVVSRLFKIDLDCTMVTLTAGLYGPAFVPALTRQLKNDALTLPGLICGSVGYAVGTFLGAGIGLLLF
jgi:uncharacterized membrane protein